MIVDKITSIISGFSFSVGYILLKVDFFSIDNIIDIIILIIKTSIVGMLGGFCGLLGKEIFNNLKKKFSK